MRYQGFFLVLILCLTLGLQFSYRLFADHYSDEHELVKNISQLKQEKEREKLQTELVRAELEDFRGFAIKSLGQKQALAWEEKQWLHSARSPASVSVVSNEVHSRTALMQAKKDFQNQQFTDSALKLKKLIDEYPLSRDIIETHFLLAESYYLSGQFEQSLDVIDQMMALFPDSELTGFIMLRMGQILERKNRRDEAIEVYQVVEEQFPKSRELQSQVDSRLNLVRKLE